jgi:lysophospholipid acyltransferase (LPLAT)-like uncharacterized protein
MHNDGQIAAKALSYLSINTVNGSSSRGALRSLMQLRQKLNSACHIAITPDGPKGPAEIAKQGAVLLSSSTKAKLFPVSIVSERYWQLKSWDKMFIPKPFSRLIIMAAAPYAVPESLSKVQLDHESAKLELCLKNLKLQAQSSLKS